MRKNNCELIRRELDELMVDETCSSSALEHLRECVECREFQEKQTKLRQIVGSLGTVAAPSDFDFRLRARLANESSSAASQFGYWSRRGFAVAALLLVLATGAVLVRNVLDKPVAVNNVATRQEPHVQQPANPVETLAPVPVNSDRNLVAGIPNKRTEPGKTERSGQGGSRNKRQLVAFDFSSERAEVINGMEAVGTSAAFPIDASLEPFKVSLDDGRGNARTISVPTISFGSQRIVQNANQFAPKRVW
jgi:hypothetical protein